MNDDLKNSIGSSSYTFELKDVPLNNLLNICNSIDEFLKFLNEEKLRVYDIIEKESKNDTGEELVSEIKETDA